MTEYAREAAAIQAAGADVVALSVDDTARSRALRAQLALPFPILCDSERAVVRAWDLFNPREMGGIAIPAVFVIDRERRVRYRSIDATRSRVETRGVLEFLRGAADDVRRSNIRPGLRNFGRALTNALRRGARTRSSGES